MLAIPARHPLLVHKRVPLGELTRYPLVMGDPLMCEGSFRELNRLLRTQGQEPKIVEHVASLDMMHTLVAAGYGVGFTTAARVAICQYPDIVSRPLAIESAVVTTYLLRLDNDSPSLPLERLTARLHSQIEN